MNYVEIFNKENSGFIDEYRTEMGRVQEIKNKCKLDGHLKDYFEKTASFLSIFEEITDKVEAKTIENMSLPEAKALNEKIYIDILGDNYKNSYANTEFAVKVLGKELGQLLSFVYVNGRNKIESTFAYRLFDVVSSLKLFNEVYNVLAQDNEDIDGVKKAIEENAFANVNIAYDEKFRKFIDKDRDYLKSIIMESDLTDLRYLYKYDGYVSDREIAIANFFNGLSEEKVKSMANTYTEGYERGFVTNNLDISKKKFVNIYYSIGFERMARAAIENFKKIGLDAVCTLYQPYYTNRQYKYDHRYDYAIYLNDNYMKKSLEAVEKACQKYEDLLCLYGGPAAIETFGEKNFEPKNKKESIALTTEQRELDVKLSREMSILRNKYMKGNETSFTIIAYPTPEIGERFNEIFEETIKVNNLDNKLYGDIQQSIIDALDKGDYVRVLGMGKNKTDLKVNLYKLKDPSKETIFENCRADVNIPVGEVFTSPVLSGTNGKLHVTEVFLNGLKYKDLEIDLIDGMIASYNCNNFDNDEENKKFVKENILFNHESIPIGEFAIGTNTTAYVMGQKYGIQDKLPILIAEKTGPHFAMGDTCYSMSEDNKVYNPDGKEIVAKDNEKSILRKTDMSKAYFNCHTDITIPYDELGEIAVYTKTGEKIIIIENGRFVLKGTEKLNEPLDEK